MFLIGIPDQIATLPLERTACLEKLSQAYRFLPPGVGVSTQGSAVTPEVPSPSRPRTEPPRKEGCRLTGGESGLPGRKAAFDSAQLRLPRNARRPRPAPGPGRTAAPCSGPGAGWPLSRVRNQIPRTRGSDTPSREASPADPSHAPPPASVAAKPVHGSGHFHLEDPGPAESALRCPRSGADHVTCRLARLSAVHDLVFSVIVFVLRFPTSLQGSLRFLRFLLFLLFTGQAPVDILVSP
ncbi:uncharacterized protein LOC122226020 [Panthera leo]|uniref:uncharacterized protein LOC122226020 n=1 Tax=Panthera leo TaxID=9689 RepID=UPI001C696CBC|nr:uncharacterized protein LOC122226020 [Panthera leo]